MNLFPNVSHALPSSGKQKQTEGLMKLTKSGLAALAVPRGKAERIELDDKIPGFGVRLRAGGSRTWIFQYRQGNKQRRISFGSCDAVPVGEARERAEKLYAKVKLGQDPAGAKIEARAKAAETVEPAMRRFVDWQRGRLRPNYIRAVERYLLRYARPLHELQLAKVSRRAVADLLAEIARNNGPVAANRLRAALSKFFAWAMSEGLIETNPVIATNKATEKGARDRVLDDRELRLIWNAASDDHYGAIIKLLALTGQRRDEIGALCWSEIDQERRTITLPASRTKNKREHVVPLSEAAWTIIEAQPRRASVDGDERDLLFGHGPGPFSGWSKAKASLDHDVAEADGGEPLAAWTLHDLRRTVATVMADRLGIQPHIIEAVLNHVSGHKGGVAGVYNRASYESEKRIALDRWAAHLDAIVKGQSKIVKMKRA